MATARDECHKCGSNMRHVSRSEQTFGGGHHRNRFYCPECDEDRYRG